ncbi:hypothetical protein GCM10012275_45790 [Longimycelium tulufanense]|uniref:Prepilin type IV endopeptidase peptidase domain-containing protein n=1 Tax=Longimycelium tulufanense TaxID=907463 RepID=A0A8J3CBK2_9PSEU|nr:hypothetical protein GCM10012275_45790 [Longimycelium tulufanense]
MLWTVATTIAAFGGFPAWWLPVPLALGWLAVLLTATDLARRRLPDALTLPAYPAAVVLLAVVSWLGPGVDLALRALGGACLFGLAHAAVHLVAPTALGAGDVKLAGVLGALLGAVSWLALIQGAFLAGLVTLGLAALRPKTALPGVPHGPGLLTATWTITVLPPAASPFG